MASPAPHSDAAIEARIKRLHDQLKITPAEADRLNAVAQVMRDNEQELGSLMRQRSKNANVMSAVDNLQSYEQIADAHADGLKKLMPAFQALYDAMPDTQKKVADSVFSQRVRAHATSSATKPSNG